MLKRSLWYVLAVVLVACGVEGSSLLISDTQEAEIGAQVHQQVLAEYPLYSDPTVQSWVNDIGARMAAVSTSERTGVNYQFFVLDADLVNAFAAPGGYVYLTRGLILEATSEAEVAGVLGHEIGHVAHRHGVAKLERAAAAGVLTDLILGDGVASDVVVFATNFVLTTDYSQDQETDADEQGVDFAYRAGYNPYGMVSFFEKLAVLSEGSLIPDWLSSHPNPADRAERARLQILSLDPSLTETSPGFSWEQTGNFSTVQSILGTGQPVP